MSIPVAVADLRTTAAHHGRAAFLLSVGGDGRPRVLHLEPVWLEPGRLRFEVSERTAAALRTRPEVTLLWGEATTGRHVGRSLIADGVVDVIDELAVEVVVQRAVIHREAPRPQGP